MIDKLEPSEVPLLDDLLARLVRENQTRWML
jgi:hypothetical protein